MRHGWQLDRAPWKRLAVLCAPREWRRTYLEDAYRDTVPTSPGVYLICSSVQDGIATSGASADLYKRLYNALYAGQAKNLHSRFGQHLRGYRNVAKARAIFRRLDYWYTRVSLTELDELEQCFLDALGPAANDKNVLARVGSPVPAGSIRGRTTRS